MREYLRVTPTSERLDPEGIPQVLESLHKLASTESTGLADKLNPLHSETPPRFEFLALSDGADDPVEFYYGVDEHFDTFEKRLRSVYPATFDIERVEIDIASRLVQPVEFTREEFIGQYTAGKLQYEFGPDERYELVTDDEDRTAAAESDSLADSGTTADPSADYIIEVGDTALELAPPDAIPANEPLTTLAKPTVTAEGTVLARPATDTVPPLGVRWQGSAARKQDWMTSLAPFTADNSEEALSAVDQPGGALASLVDHLMEATAPVAFQVVFQRRESWQADAELRKEDVIDGRDTLAQEIIGSLFEFDDQSEHRDKNQLSDSVAKRVEAIEAKNPKRSFTANTRAIGVPLDDNGRDDLDERMQSLASVFDTLDGPYYEVAAERLRDSGFREATKERNTRAALQRLLARDITTGRGKTRPEFVVSGRELANFILVPSSEQLTVEGTRGTRAEQQSRNPLPRPHQDLMGEFRDGMAIGYALDDNGDSEDEPTHIPPGLLPTHYGRFGTTGSGKSKALINDMLSLYANTEGPTVLINPKNDNMAQNYMRAHARRFGMTDLEENVVYFPMPDMLPGFSFFDLEPSMESGRRREDAIQRKADHYEEILKLVMGTDRYERATVAPTLIKTLIKTLFDEEYGRENGQYRESTDYFAHRQLEHVVDQLWDAGPPKANLGDAPRSSDEEVTRTIRRQLQLDSNTFANVMGGVGNRLAYISQDTHLRQIFNNTENQFDFRDLLNEDTVILFDLGDLRDDAARIMTGVILTNLDAALKDRKRALSQHSDDYVVNLLVDEAASVVVSNIMNDLLEKGRGFRLSVGLSMQFPEQMEAEGGRKIYLNALNNIGSSLIGKSTSTENWRERWLMKRWTPRISPTGFARCREESGSPACQARRSVKPGRIRSVSNHSRFHRATPRVSSRSQSVKKCSSLRRSPRCTSTSVTDTVCRVSQTPQQREHLPTYTRFSISQATTWTVRLRRWFGVSSFERDAVRRTAGWLSKQLTMNSDGSSTTAPPNRHRMMHSRTSANAHDTSIRPSISTPTNSASGSLKPEKRSRHPILVACRPLVGVPTTQHSSRSKKSSPHSASPFRSSHRMGVRSQTRGRATPTLTTASPSKSKRRHPRIPQRYSQTSGKPKRQETSRCLSFDQETTKRSGPSVSTAFSRRPFATSRMVRHGSTRPTRISRSTAERPKKVG